MSRMTWPGAKTAPRLALAGLTLSLAFLVPRLVRAANVSYKMQPILKIGDTANGLATTPDYVFVVGGLNDRGELALGVESFVRHWALLLQYADGLFTTIVGPGLDAPGVSGGTFPADVIWGDPFATNQPGNIVF